MHTPHPMPATHPPCTRTHRAASPVDQIPAAIGQREPEVQRCLSRYASCPNLALRRSIERLLQMRSALTADVAASGRGDDPPDPGPPRPRVRAGRPLSASTGHGRLPARSPSAHDARRATACPPRAARRGPTQRRREAAPTYRPAPARRRGLRPPVPPRAAHTAPSRSSSGSTNVSSARGTVGPATRRVPPRPKPYLKLRYAPGRRREREIGTGPAPTPPHALPTALPQFPDQGIDQGPRRRAANAGAAPALDPRRGPWRAVYGDVPPLSRSSAATSYLCLEVHRLPRVCVRAPWRARLPAGGAGAQTPSARRSRAHCL